MSCVSSNSKDCDGGYYEVIFVVHYRHHIHFHILIMQNFIPPPSRRWITCKLLLVGLLLGACEPKLEAPMPASTSTDASASSRIMQGDGRNPFSVAVMREALRNLTGKRALAPTTKPKANLQDPAIAYLIPYNPDDPGDCPGCGGGGDPVQPTHHYVRFKAADANQLADLDDLGIELSREPLDENAAASYQARTTDDIPWLYTAVPSDVPLPAHIQQERIAELFLFTAEDGDMQDEDPWEPDPTPPPVPCEPEWDPNCRCYRPCAMERATKRKRNRIKEATVRLKKANISPAALYDEAMRITGHEDEMLRAAAVPAGTAQRPTGTRYRPGGIISVERRTTTTGRGPDVPLRNVEVLSRRWFQLGRARTDQNGRYAIQTSYSKEAKLIVEFKTERATTRGITPVMRPWDLVLPIRHQMGSYSRTGMENMRFSFTYQTDPNTNGALAWTAATLFNSLDDMYAQCAANNIPTPPSGLNIMLLSDLTASASAPMLRKIAETSIVSATLGALLPPTASAIKLVLQRQLPDITCRYGITRFGTTRALLTNELDNTFFHELGHAVHYGRVGNPFWTSYIGAIVQASVRGRVSIYGRKFDEEGGRIAVSEAWGNYIGGTFTAGKYDAIDANISAANRQDLENQVPNDNVDDDDGWIVYGMFYDMTDVGEPTGTGGTGVTDNVNTYTTRQLFQALGSDIVSVRGFQQRVIGTNPSPQTAELEQLVTSYRW